MPNGKEINARLEFQTRIEGMPVEKRTAETALMIYDLSRKFDECILGNPKKSGAISGSITGGIAGLAIALLEYFKVGH